MFFAFTTSMTRCLAYEMVPLTLDKISPIFFEIDFWIVVVKEKEL